MKPLSTTRRFTATLVLGGLSGMLTWMLGQDMQRGPVRSPHGPLTIPCNSCHTSISWSPLRAVLEFNHNRETRYPLQGLHQKVECRQCHANLVFRQTPVSCADCHADLHRRQFGAQCESCHTVKGWQPAAKSIREHSPRFPLTGGHAAVDCERCHRGAAAAQYAGLSTQCGSCHMTDYLNAKTINHRAAGFPITCGQCHGVDTWLSVNLNGSSHASFGFALTGAHVTTPCAQCHLNGQFANAPTQCQGCHLTAFNKTTDPNHVTAGFPQDCSLCHSTATWLGAIFDHSRTGFALTGAHAPLQCATCHTSGRFTGLSAACVSCHLTDFKNVTNPNHVSGGFPQTCEVCHATTAWSPASFNHNATTFPLTGAHVNVACTSCHINNVFAGTPTDCYSCHKTEYQTTNNPNHAAANFPTTCATCHTTTTWTGATFTHSQFPIFSGTHAHAWTTCADCHTNSSNYQVFSCITCHTHDQADTDPHHRGVRNYVYAATTCYSCHRTGGGGGL